MPSLPRRAIFKTLSYKSIMLFVHFGVGYGLTGSWVFGSALAFIDLVLGVIIFYYHDRLWSTKIRFGKGTEEPVTEEQREGDWNLDCDDE